MQISGEPPSGVFVIRDHPLDEQSKSRLSIGQLEQEAIALGIPVPRHDPRGHQLTQNRDRLEVVRVNAAPGPSLKQDEPTRRCAGHCMQLKETITRADIEGPLFEQPPAGIPQEMRRSFAPEL
jgi:hypothetical protein